MSQIAPIFPVKVTKILNSGGFCPFQMEFLDDQGNWGYLRYRGGYLRCGIAASEDEFWRGEYKWVYNVINEQIGDRYDGSPDDALFREKLEGKLILPEGFKFEGDTHYESN
jgi:hypothetical protein